MTAADLHTRPQPEESARLAAALTVARRTVARTRIPTWWRDDLEQAALVAAWHTSRHYDPNRIPGAIRDGDATFAAVVTQRVTWAIQDEIRRLDRATRPGRDSIQAVDTATDRLVTRLHRQPTRTELAAEAGTDTIAAAAAARAAAHPMSLHATTLDDPDVDPLDPPDPHAPDPEAEAEATALRDALDAAVLRLLSPPQARAIELRYHYHHPLTLIAEVEQVTEAAVSRRITRALARLRHAPELSAWVRPDTRPPNA